MGANGCLPGRMPMSAVARQQVGQTGAVLLWLGGAEGSRRASSAHGQMLPCLCRATRWTRSRRGVTCSRALRAWCPLWARLAATNTCTRYAVHGVIWGCSWACVVAVARSLLLGTLTSPCPAPHLRQTCGASDMRLAAAAFLPVTHTLLC